MFGLAHLDVMPLIYGFVIFVGLWSMWAKLLHGMWFALAVEVFVFWLVFSLHGGSMTGGMAAAFAALFAGYIFPRSLRRRSHG
jgi:hypothetical protein